MSSASAALPQPGRTKAFLRLVMIEHSIFALPFAYIAALTAMYEWDRNIHWGRLLLVTVCMVGLRTFAMAVNRIIDREIDARNPRTAHRELVTGAMSVRHAWTGALIALVIFLGAAALLNPLCLALAPIAVIPMVVYPYGKRFTDFPQAIALTAAARLQRTRETNTERFIARARRGAIELNEPGEQVDEIKRGELPHRDMLMFDGGFHQLLEVFRRRFVAN